ncbi:hypothetical protein [Nocardia ninae]|uniref:Uncharacterized protein n=1 Tax=Nocardia ninae NBRC 108245 TaxID=1210091 RepID=A0A511M9T0_9NOCA|nr:hypothetical protein [Nocardia ninae]GEM37415.1 hypothetical protein NN4_19340 [Nocardia ninae NBRC 108245]
MTRTDDVVAPTVEEFGVKLTYDDFRCLEAFVGQIAGHWARNGDATERAQAAYERIWRALRDARIETFGELERF